jgi:hypothetical protein
MTSLKFYCGLIIVIGTIFLIIISIYILGHWYEGWYLNGLSQYNGFLSNLLTGSVPFLIPLIFFILEAVLIKSILHFYNENKK